MRKSRFSEGQIIGILKEHQAGSDLGGRGEALLAATCVPLIDIEPKTYRYASTRGDDAVLRQRLRDLASLRRRATLG